MMSELSPHEHPPSSPERWHSVAGFGSLYEAGDRGHVRSLDLEVRNTTVSTRLRKGRILKTKVPNHGYPMVALSKDGVVTYHLVHRLVAEAFCPKPECVDPAKLTVNHKNFNKLDNRAENLEWVTQSDNLSHSGRAGRMIRANVTKLTEDDVRVIRKRLAAGETLSAIAQDYGVAHTAIYKIKAGLRWRHVK